MKANETKGFEIWLILQTNPDHDRKSIVFKQTRDRQLKCSQTLIWEQSRRRYCGKVTMNGNCITPRWCSTIVAGYLQNLARRVHLFVSKAHSNDSKATREKLRQVKLLTKRATVGEVTSRPITHPDNCHKLDVYMAVFCKTLNVCQQISYQDQPMLLTKQSSNLPFGITIFVHLCVVLPSLP